MEAIQGLAIEGGTLYALARINAGDGGPIDQASLDEVNAELWKINPPADLIGRGRSGRYIELEDGPEQFGDTLSLTIADVVFDVLQTDARWTLDDEGYNFRLALGPADFDVIAKADYPKSQWYRIDVQFKPVSGTPFIASYLIELQSSLFGKA